MVIRAHQEERRQNFGLVYLGFFGRRFILSFPFFRKAISFSNTTVQVYEMLLVFLGGRKNKIGSRRGRNINIIMDCIQ